MKILHIPYDRFWTYNTYVKDTGFAGQAWENNNGYILFNQWLKLLLLNWNNPLMTYNNGHFCI